MQIDNTIPCLVQFNKKQKWKSLDETLLIFSGTAILTTLKGNWCSFLSGMLMLNLTKISWEERAIPSPFLHPSPAQFPSKLNRSPSCPGSSDVTEQAKAVG